MRQVKATRALDINERELRAHGRCEMTNLFLRSESAIAKLGYGTVGYVRPTALIPAALFLAACIFIIWGLQSAEKFVVIAGAALAIFLCCQEIFVRFPSQWTAMLCGVRGGLIAWFVGYSTVVAGYQQAHLQFDAPFELFTWFLLMSPFLLYGGARAYRDFSKTV